VLFVHNDESVMTHVTIYHNPSCGTSRNVLAMIRERGIEPTVIEYLKTPPSRDELVRLINASGLTVREVLREKCHLMKSSDWAIPSGLMRSCWIS